MTDTLRDKQRLNNDNIEYSNLEQNILTRNIDKAEAFFITNPDLFNYRTFRQINGDGPQLNNRLRGIDNQQMSAFLNVKTSALSLLRPKIRIFKVIYEEFKEVDGHPDQGTVTALKHPCYKEFKFSDNFGVETALTAQDYLKYESTKPNWRNVGLKSFDFVHNGENSGPIQRDVSCTLTLTFKSLKDIQASPPGEPPPDKGGLRYSDLVSWSPAALDASLSDNYNPKHYEIKVLLGYTKPSKEQLRALNLSERDVAALNNIEKTNLILSLNITDYDFSIMEDGSVEMTLNYRASAEASMATNQTNFFGNTSKITGRGPEISYKADPDYNLSNIYRLDSTLSVISTGLARPSCKTDKCEAIRKLKQLIASDKIFADLVKDLFSEGSKLKSDTGMTLDKSGSLKFLGSDTSALKFFKTTNAIALMRARVRQRIGLYKKDVYRSFMDQLIDGNNEDLMAPGSRLFCINVDSQEVLKTIVTDEIVDEANSRPGVERQGPVTTTVVDNQAAASAIEASAKIGRCHLVAPTDQQARTDLAQQLATELDSGETTLIKPQSIRDSTGENFRFYW